SKRVAGGPVGANSGPAGGEEGHPEVHAGLTEPFMQELAKAGQVPPHVLELRTVIDEGRLPEPLELEMVRVLQPV
ncbi:MAG: hypothetical protein ACE5Q6_26485, partial [Dehalococcoidia bacterium]